MSSQPSNGAARAAPGSPRSMHILIVENHEDTRFLLALLLEQLGHRVTAAATMREALEAARGERADVLISDIGLPDGSGWELAELLVERRPRYAIAMSGFGQASDREKSLAAGYRHHLLKPVEPNLLETLLDEAAEELFGAERRLQAGF